MTYDMDGNPIPLYEDTQARIIGRDRLWWGGVVSTVYIGVDLGFNGGVPLIFETMVFDRFGESIFCDRSASVLAAKVAHRLIVKTFSGVAGVKEWLRAELAHLF